MAQRTTRTVASRLLDKHHAGSRLQCLADRVSVRTPVRTKFNLTIGDAEISQTALILCLTGLADRLKQRIIGCTGDRKQFISRSQQPEQAGRDRLGA